MLGCQRLATQHLQGGLKGHPPSLATSAQGVSIHFAAGGGDLAAEPSGRQQANAPLSAGKERACPHWTLLVAGPLGGAVRSDWSLKLGKKAAPRTGQVGGAADLLAAMLALDKRHEEAVQHDGRQEPSSNWRCSFPLRPGRCVRAGQQGLSCGSAEGECPGEGAAKGSQMV